MSDFAGMEDLLQDFLIEAGDLLSGVDNKLVDLERTPQDLSLLNEIFRGFHTIKGGAGFLNATELVTLCHLTENLFDKLRTGELVVKAEMLDVILAATADVRRMFSELERDLQPTPAESNLIEQLKLALSGSLGAAKAPVAKPSVAIVVPAESKGNGPDWDAYYAAVTGEVPAVSASVPVAVAEEEEEAHISDDVADHIVKSAVGRRTSDKPGYQGPPGGRRDGERQRDNSIRVDTARLDQVLNLSGEIGLTKNRLNALRSDILNGKNDTDTLHALDLAVSQLDLLVSDLQNAVMKTRMQPIGRLFQKYPRIARDLARSLGKDVEMVLVGEETEIDKTMIEDLSDPIIHLIRNAVDHGIEAQNERLSAGKREKSYVTLEARQEGDHIVIIVSDDGRGMNPERLRARALEKGLISDEEANTMDERQSFNLIFLPGFSTAATVSDVSGRGVGMDVVRTNIQKLNGSIDIRSEQGKGTSFVISLPLTLAILPVLLVCLGEQPFAVPLSMVREILPIEPKEVQELGGRATMVVRGEVLPVVTLAALLGWPQERVPEYGVLMQSAEQSFILAIDSFAGREDAVIKSLDDFRPKGVAGVTTLSNGQIVLILDMKELLSGMGDQRVITRAQLMLEGIAVPAAA
ncbi:MAG: chemotaxis protein CheA [Candidatus Dactylopiibacterium carminicum]|uniref:Chemotaxis protein CheA n=1 Tax=Candidatus Dactylopiibacterium carminicum TaxID=857335 RepID=A0A272ERR3_9RHOO|nr:chemotaxis protein CheA [Candidatus Dactylopiibacterium carminicum]KAF7598898.1 chemotaxis protein CheA [Candidatus Dactylopiibacterium carminicum]PAS92803.1 MAG: chemotaxis protein CheA [Candidatus Dactylopiibacterium carminicum]PAS96255.1 MAG: chemotaxis protein CheA [Candidatus Dactylopiibacterium carminicum]PAS98916.1 MAG: chemotaxis protein CheA [Candidatus Dactylopiibacterium carminicum]